jgi:hypothetical protein
MTGSGKTGLLFVFVEEALRAGVPVLMVDVKGDLTNLALTFAVGDREAFVPWVDVAGTVAQGRTVEAVTAELCSGRDAGLARAGISSDDVSDFRARTFVSSRPEPPAENRSICSRPSSAARRSGTATKKPPATASPPPSRSSCDCSVEIATPHDPANMCCSLFSLSASCVRDSPRTSRRCCKTSKSRRSIGWARWRLIASCPRKTATRSPQRSTPSSPRRASPRGVRAARWTCPSGSRHPKGEPRPRW